MFERLRAGLVVDDDSLAFDAIAEVGPGGMFLGHEHTLERFRTEVFMSPLFRSQAYPTWVKQGSRTSEVIATEQWKALLDSYEDPGIDESVDAALREYIDRRTREIDT